MWMKDQPTIITVKRITNPQTMETAIHKMMKRETMITVSPEKRNDKLVSQMETIMKRTKYTLLL